LAAQVALLIAITPHCLTRQLLAILESMEAVELALLVHLRRVPAGKV
jgi:hypothetical protein